MSHFSVAVFSHSIDEIDELLAPFNEDIEAGSPYGEFVENNDSDLDETTGKKGYWRNPNARWDWYTIGGRWRGLLKLLPGKSGTYGIDCAKEERQRLEPGRCDSALVSDCDLSRDEAACQRASRFWEIAVEKRPMTEVEKKEFIVLYNENYYRERYGSKESFAEHEAAFSTYAFVTAEGEWHETGRMGWWGIDDSTKDSLDTYTKEFEAYLEEAREKDLLITIVDCHI